MFKHCFCYGSPLDPFWFPSTSEFNDPAGKLNEIQHPGGPENISYETGRVNNLERVVGAGPMTIAVRPTIHGLRRPPLRRLLINNPGQNALETTIDLADTPGEASWFRISLWGFQLEMKALPSVNSDNDMS